MLFPRHKPPYSFQKQHLLRALLSQLHLPIPRASLLKLRLRILVPLYLLFIYFCFPPQPVLKYIFLQVSCFYGIFFLLNFPETKTAASAVANDVSLDPLRSSASADLRASADSADLRASVDSVDLRASVDSLDLRASADLRAIDEDGPSSEATKKSGYFFFFFLIYLL